MHERKTQTHQVRAYMKRHGSITPREALRELGVMRLGARIWELRQDNVSIHRTMVAVRTRAGETRVARYSLS
jgi:hypothetical protein